MEAAIAANTHPLPRRKSPRTKSVAAAPVEPLPTKETGRRLSATKVGRVLRFSKADEKENTESGSRRERGRVTRAQNNDAARVLSPVNPNTRSAPGNRQKVPAKPATSARFAILAEWTQEQRQAFERQRMSVGADELHYWERIAAGVDGKNADECRELLEAVWKKSPEKDAATVEREQLKALKFISKFEKRPETPTGQKLGNGVHKKTVSTPEALAHVQKAGRTKRGRATAKYRRNVRKLGESVARNTPDELLEPRVETPQLYRDLVQAQGGSNVATPITFSNYGTQFFGDKECTPGTEVRMKRAELDRKGRVVTPEIFARANREGPDKADAYLAAFKRNYDALPAAAAAAEDDDDDDEQAAGDSERGGDEVDVKLDDVDKMTSDAFALLPRKVMFFDDVDDSDEEDGELLET